MSPRAASRPTRAQLVIPRPPVGGLIVLLLAGCGTSEPPPLCPLTQVVQGAERTAAYRDRVTPAPEELRYLALITDLSSNCNYDQDGVVLDLSFSLIVEKGPAFGGGPARLTYFVASVDPDGQLAHKQLFTARVDFTDGRERAGSAQELVLRYPVISPSSGPGYRFFIGFQLDQAQLRERLRS